MYNGLPRPSFDFKFSPILSCLSNILRVEGVFHDAKNERHSHVIGAERLAFLT